MLLLLILSNTVLEIVARAIRQENEIKDIHIRKKWGKTISIHKWLDLLHRKFQGIKKKEKKGKKEALVNNFSKAAGYKIIIQNSLVFLHTSNEQSEIELKKTIPLW